MYKYYFFFSFAVSSIFFCSCEEDFNLKADYKPRFSLNCIVRADTSVHIATISKSYMVSGFDPYEYNEDPFISGALVRIWHDDDVYFFSDTLIPRKDTSRFNEPQKAYVLRNYTPNENDFLEIKAILENGKTLYGVTRVPVRTSWDTSSTFLLPGEVQDEFTIKWLKKSNIGWFHIRLLIRYKNDGKFSPTLSAQIPVKYDGDIPIYSSPTKGSGMAYKLAAFERTMRDLSKDQPDKSKIFVYGILIELLVFDDNLSKYFSNSKGYMDDYTVRVDQTDYSNIEGGFGIFGSYIKQNGGIQIEEEYIRSFGYEVP